MKKILLLTLLIPANAWCESDIGGFQTLLSDKLKESKAMGIVSMYGKPAVAAFLPVKTFHAMYDVDSSGKQIEDTMRDYVEIGVGYRAQKDDKPYAFAGVGVNLVGLSRRFTDCRWTRDHVKSSLFPPIFIGPTIHVPFDLKRVEKMNVVDSIGVMAGVRFGGK